MCTYTLVPMTVKVLKTFLEATLQKSFQLFRRILNEVTKVLPLQSWFQLREQVNISCCQVRREWGTLQHCHIVLWYEILDRKWPVCWSIVVKKKLTVDSQFFKVFPPDHTPRVKKDVNVNYFIHGSNCSKLYQWIPGDFWNYHVY